MPSSADPVDYTLEVLLPKMQAAREVSGVVANVHHTLSLLGGDIMNVFYVLWGFLSLSNITPPVSDQTLVRADGTQAEMPKSNITPLGPEDSQPFGPSPSKTFNYWFIPRGHLALLKVADLAELFFWQPLLPAQTQNP